MKTYRAVNTWGWCWERAETKRCNLVRFFFHGRGVGFLSIASDHDLIIGFIKNGVGAWRWVNEWEPIE